MESKIPDLPESVKLLTELPNGNLPNVKLEADTYSLIWSSMGDRNFCGGFRLQIATGVVTVLEGIVYPEGGAIVRPGKNLTIRNSTVVNFVPSLDDFVRVNLWVI